MSRSIFVLPRLATALSSVLLLACEPSASTTAPEPSASESEGVAEKDKDLSPVLLATEEPAVSLGVWFATGSQDDPEGKEGLAYLTGQMLGEAGTAQKSYEEILEALYPMAASYGVKVDVEMTTLRGRVHKDKLAGFEGLFHSAYLEPKFDASDLERVRSDALSYLQKTLRYASDEELGKAALRAFVYEGTRYAHPSVGTVEGLESITMDDIRAFYATHYGPERTVFAAGGGFEQGLVDRLEATRSQLPEGGADTAPDSMPAPFEGRHLMLVNKPGADASISMGHPISVRRGEREFYALWIANSWLGEHRNSSSHLYQVIRETRGMNYGDYSYIEAFPQGGFRSMPPQNVGRDQQLFEIWIRTLPNERAHFALRAAIREYEKLASEGMSQEAFELTRSFLSKYALHFADNTSARLGYAIDDRYFGLDEPHLERFRKMMGEITLDEVNAAIQKHFNPAHLKIAIVTGEAEKLRDAIVSEASSPIVYESKKPAEVLAEDELIAEHKLGVEPERVQVIPVDEMFQR